jgi:hypothetical protein
LNESRLDLIPILFFDRGYNLEYNIGAMRNLQVTLGILTVAPAEVNFPNSGRARSDSLLFRSSQAE